MNYKIIEAEKRVMFTSEAINIHKQIGKNIPEASAPSVLVIGDGKRLRRIILLPLLFRSGFEF